MVLTEQISLPSNDELTIPEINLSTSALRAGAFHLGKACENENNVNITKPNLSENYVINPNI